MLKVFKKEDLTYAFYHDPTRFDYMLEKGLALRSLFDRLKVIEKSVRDSFLSMDFTLLKTMVSNWERHLSLRERVQQIPCYTDTGGRALRAQLRLISEAVDRQYTTLPVQSVLKPDAATSALIKSRRSRWIAAAIGTATAAVAISFIPFLLDITLTTPWIAGIITSLVVAGALTAFFSIHAHRCTAPVLRKRFLKIQSDFNMAVRATNEKCDRHTS